MRYMAKVGGERFAIEVSRRGSGRYAVSLDGVERMIETRAAAGSTLLSMDGQAIEAFVIRKGGDAGAGTSRTYDVAIAGRHYEVGLADPLRQGLPAADTREQVSADVRSVMPGKIVALLVGEGDRVREGQGLVVVEAMKMENEIPSPRDGRVARLKVRKGEAVEAGALLVSLE